MKKLFTLLLGLCVAAAVAYAVPKDVGKVPVKPLIEKVLQHVVPTADVPTNAVVVVKELSVSDYWRIAKAAKDMTDAELRIGESPGLWISNDKITLSISRRLPEAYLDGGRSWRDVANSLKHRFEERESSSLVRRC